jgi:lysophospholipase L1-like esterase
MFLSALLAACAAAPAPAPKAFDLKDGDRIVWIGSTLVEREQRYGYWETALHVAFPKANFTLRNLGWSGDTVFGESRGRFDYANPDKCFHQLVDQTLALKPTVIFISYGTNESFEGKDGLPKFEKGLEKLLDALKPANARIVLFSPMPVWKSASIPDPKPMNDRLGRYSATIKSVAEKRGLYFGDLFDRAFTCFLHCMLQAQGVVGPQLSELTKNGMHLTQLGYEATTPAFLLSLGLDADYPRWDEKGLLATKKLEPLRKAVVEKNQLFFHRWRPENETYLFGFRKHEQGKNAKEVAEFDPLVAKAEEGIAKQVKELKK